MTARCSLWWLCLLLLVASAASQSAQVLVLAETGSGAAHESAGHAADMAGGRHSRDSSSASGMLDADTLIQYAMNPLRQTNTYKGLMSDLNEVGQQGYAGLNRVSGALGNQYQQIQDYMANRYASSEDMVLKALEMVLSNPQQFCANYARNGLQATAAQAAQQAGQTMGDALSQAGSASSQAGQSAGNFVRALPSFGWGR